MLVRHYATAFYQLLKETQMRKVASALLLLALTACGSAATGTDSTGASTPAASPAPSAVASPAASAPMPSMSGELTAPEGSAASGDSSAVDLKGSQMLAAKLNTSADTLKLVSKEQTEWSDSSLGCPDPATMYMQVITPGWKLTYNDGARDYDVRSNQDGSLMVWCDGGAPKTLPQP
jgi:hypothetical protein